MEVAAGGEAADAARGVAPVGLPRAPLSGKGWDSTAARRVAEDEDLGAKVVRRWGRDDAKTSDAAWRLEVTEGAGTAVDAGVCAGAGPAGLWETEDLPLVEGVGDEVAGRDAPRSPPPRARWDLNSGLAVLEPGRLGTRRMRDSGSFMRWRQPPTRVRTHHVSSVTSPAPIRVLMSGKFHHVPVPHDQSCAH